MYQLEVEVELQLHLQVMFAKRTATTRTQNFERQAARRAPNHPTVG